MSDIIIAEKNKFKLPKAFERKDYRGGWVHDDKWLSNGYFMVRREAVKEDFKYCHPEQPATNIDRLFPTETHYEFHRTNRLLDNGEYYLRIFKDKDSDKEVVFKDDYIQHFRVFILECKEFEGVYKTSNDLIVLAPHKWPA